jgi:hypothetical protein
MNDRPQVSEVDGLKLEAAMLRAQLAESQAINAQQVWQKHRDDFAVMAKGLEVDGYQLHRTNDGAWIYQPTPVREMA